MFMEFKQHRKTAKKNFHFIIRNNEKVVAACCYLRCTYYHTYTYFDNNKRAKAKVSQCLIV